MPDHSGGFLFNIELRIKAVVLKLELFQLPKLNKFTITQINTKHKDKIKFTLIFPFSERMDSCHWALMPNADPCFRVHIFPVGIISNTRHFFGLSGIGMFDYDYDYDYEVENNRKFIIIHTHPATDHSSPWNLIRFSSHDGYTL